MYGRELGARAVANQESKSLEKSASNGEGSEERVQRVSALVDDLQFRDRKEKLAFNEGAYQMLEEFDQAIDQGTSPEDIQSQIKEAKNDLQKEAVAADNEDEQEEMFEQMVKGAAEQAALLSGEDEVSDDTLQAARDLVAEELSA